MPMRSTDAQMLTWIQCWSWHSMRRLTGLQERVRRRFTPAGQVVLIGTLIAGLFGVDTRQTLAFQAFGLGMALLLVAWLGSLRRPRGLVARRLLPSHATVGIPCRYRVEVEQHGGKPIAGLVLDERMPDPRPDLQTFLHVRAPGEKNVNPVDRLFGYPRWRWLVEQGSWVAPGSPVSLPQLTPGTIHSVDIALTPRRRGVLHLDGLHIGRSDPLGLGRKRVQVAQRDRLVVLPRRFPIPIQRPPGRRRLQPGGVSLASVVGDAQEFIGLRDYRLGDSPRYIDWAAWARSGKPVVKEYQDEYFSRQALILDSFALPGREAAFEAAVSVAASFVEPLQGPDALLDLMFVADRAYTLTGGRGLLSAQALLEVLACVQPVRKGGFDNLSQSVLTHAPLLSAGVCVLLEWDEARRALVQQLRALDLPLRVLVVGGAEAADPGPMVDRPGDLHWLDPDGLAEGLAAL
jgi:hypothetical protein